MSMNAIVFPMLATPASPSARHDIKTCIALCGAHAGLQMVLDAGSEMSYDGSSQTWTDVTGNGNDFWRGTSNSVEASDPTFNGVVGRRSKDEFFSTDGGDYFTAKTFANWMRDFFKGTSKSQLLYVGNKVVPSSIYPVLLSTRAANSTTAYGFSIVAFADAYYNSVYFQYGIDAANATYAYAYIGDSTGGLHGVVWGMDPAANSRHYVSSNNWANTTMPSTPGNVNPSTSRLVIFGDNSYNDLAESGTGFNCLVMWNTKHSLAEQRALWLSLLGKFGFDMAT